MSFTPYPPEVEKSMKLYYNSLSEKDRRCYAAIEAMKLGHGGIKYIAKVMKCNYRTVATGIRELQAEQPFLSGNRVRREGGGRKSAWDIYPDLDQAFLIIVTLNEVKFRERRQTRAIRLNQREIEGKLKERGIYVTRSVVQKLMNKHGVYRYRDPLNPFSLKLQVVSV